MIPVSELADGVHAGNFGSIARALTLVENELPGATLLLQSLKINHQVPVVGFTGPPGAGKSSIINAVLKKWTHTGKKAAVVAVDPTSPFNFGSLLGDRIRLSEHFNDNHIFIRSMASRGALGGLCHKIIEATDVLRAAPFDFIIIETVGVGQSEVEIAGLADITVVVLVPEAGDEIQTMKAGLMEIADIFVVNKSDRSGADDFARHIEWLVHSRVPQSTSENQNRHIAVLKTIATQNHGIDELVEAIGIHLKTHHESDRKIRLLAEKAWQLISRERMKNISRHQIATRLKQEINLPGYNFYKFVNSCS